MVGNGIEGQFFDPKKAGYGTHEITYETTGGMLSCLQGSAKRQVLVLKPPVISLLARREVPWGSSFQPVQPVYADYIYQWMPPIYLSNPNQANPVITPEDSVSYTLKVTDRYGCWNEAKMQVKILYTVWIPDVFSPNGDGVNDSWELKGIERFPESELIIYNRWGNVVFYSKGYANAWDGSYEGTPAPGGNYAYQLNTNAGHVYKGTLLLLR